MNDISKQLDKFMSYQDNKATIGIEIGEKSTLRNSMDENVTRKD